ncbi:MAG TPA: cytochrome c oxidase subunit II, partial [Kofleriaceae bacterium]
MKRVLPILVVSCIVRAAYAQPAPPNPPAPPQPAQPATGPKEEVKVVPCPAEPKYKIEHVLDAELPYLTTIQVVPGATEMKLGWKGGGSFAIPAGKTECVQITDAGEYSLTGGGATAQLSLKAWYDVLADKQIEEEGTFWMPKAVNLAADESDQMFYTVLGLSLFFLFAITFVTVYFVIKYRHRPGHKAEPSTAHNDALEITWTVIPTIIVVFLFYYGWRSYIRVVTPPQKAVEIQVLAQRWTWTFTHNNGVTDSDLHVPVNTPVRLVMTSKDVLHSFYAPVMRVKQDIIPRRYTYAWFLPTKPGVYRLTCAEYCGTNHSQMGIT